MYTRLAVNYHCEMIAAETLGHINESDSHFRAVLAKKVSQCSEDESGRLVRFYSSAFVFCCNDTTAFCFTIRLFARTARSNGH